MNTHAPSAGSGWLARCPSATNPNGSAIRTAANAAAEEPAAVRVFGAEAKCIPTLISIENGITNFTDEANHTQKRTFAAYQRSSNAITAAASAKNVQCQR